MTDKAIRPLGRRMIEDMTIRKLAPKTPASDIRAVRNFTVFLGRSPDRASAEDLARLKHEVACPTLVIGVRRKFLVQGQVLRVVADVLRQGLRLVRAANYT